MSRRNSGYFVSHPVLRLQSFPREGELTGDNSHRRDRSEAKSDVPLAIRTTRRIAVLEGGLNGRGVDRPTFLTSDGNPEGTPHVLRIPTFSRPVSEGCPRPRMLYRIPETGPGS